MTKTSRRGEVVDLTYDGMPDTVYVRGHFDPADSEAADVLVAAREAFVEAAAGYYDCEGCDQCHNGAKDHPWPGPRVGFGRQTWARWLLGYDDGEFKPRMFQAYFPQGPGAFAVTEVLDLDERDRRREARAAEAAHALELRIRVLEWLPEASDLRPYGYPVGSGHIRFYLPGLAGDVCLRADGTISVQQRDLEAWEEHYAERVPPAESRRPTCT